MPDDGAISKLALDHHIENMEPLNKAFPLWCLSYRNGTIHLDEAPNRQARLQATKLVRNRARHLIKALEEADAWSLKPLWSFPIDHTDTDQEALISNGMLNKMDDFPIGYLDMWTLLSGLRVLEKTSSASFDRLSHPAEKASPRQGPAPGLSGVGNVIGNLMTFWEKELGRNYTRGFVNGQPKSGAAHFSVDVLKLIDPKVTPQQVNTSMTERIHYRNSRLKT